MTDDIKPSPEPAPTKPKRVKPKSRPDRWADAVGKAQVARTELAKILEEARAKWDEHASELEAALDELTSVKDEYDEWLGNMPENMQSSPTYDKLQEISNLSFDEWSVEEMSEDMLNEIEERLGEAESIDLPRGFGRD